ncbi:Patatin-like phospholipase [Thiorhodovibrio winogradskyi]|uniref:Patatin-like phospholipase n=1 Tax=Thiorhodovibrio winogradskyi TaxID=77007 RepID=A0ABZ0S906_9GAMM
MPAHVGVLKALDELNIGFDHIVGVSGGSIVAGLRAAGWSPAAMKQLALDVDFRQFREFNLYQLVFRGGLSSGDHFETWMNDKLDGKCFQDLTIDLHVVATDVRNGAPVVFDRHHSPNLPVARAIRYSMGIPLLFAYKEYEKHLMVDGCILSEDALRCDWARDGTPCCCFRLRAAERVGQHEGRRWVSLPDYLQLLIRAFMTTISREYVQDSFWSTTVVIDTGHISPLEFRLSPTEKLGLFDIGYSTTLAVLPTKMTNWHANTSVLPPAPKSLEPLPVLTGCE